MAVSAIAGLAATLGAAGAAGALASFGAFAAFVTSTAALTAFAIGAGLSILSRALMPKPDFGAMMEGVTGTVREPTASRKIIYGKVRVGGAVVFIANSNQNKDLYLVICFACHEIEGYEAVYLNDEKVWENGSYVSDWASYANFAFYDGTQTQGDSALSNASVFWGTDTHILNGIAYMRVKLTWDEDRKKFPQGVPNVSAVIKGKKLYDPRLDSTIGGSGSHRSGDSTTWEWSQNPALALYDYMTNTYYGLGESHLNMDYDAFGDAADVCDEAVTLEAGGTHDRYHANGVLDTANAIKGNIEALTAAMGGRIGYVDGKYFAQAAKYYTPTITIDESMMVGAMSVQTKQSRRSMYNGVKGVFLSEEENYTLVDYPAKISSEYSEDDGDPIYLDMPLPFVTDNIRAQRLAKIALLKSRQQTVVNVPLNLTALKFKAGDFIAITSDRMDWSAKPFEVIGYDLQIGSDGAIIVNVQAIETDSDVYDWTASADEDPFNEPSDPGGNDGTTVAAPTDLDLTETTSLAADGTVLPALKISWTASVDGFIEYYEVEVVELVGGVEQTDTNIFNTTTQTSILITGLKTDSTLYRVKVRAVNTIGVKSADLTNATAFNLGGDTTAPGVPTNLTANGGYKQITVSWVNPTDSDLKHVEIQVWNGSAWEDLAVVSGEVFVHFVNSFGTTKYYRVRAVDFSDNASSYTSSVSAETDFVDNDAFEQGIVDFFESQGAYAIQNGSTLPTGYGASDAGVLFFLTTDSKLYRWTGSAWTDAVVDLGDQAGQITETQITNDAITAPKLAANSVVTASMAAGTIDADRILANTITGGLLFSSGIITQVAQIGDGLITNAKIDNLAVDTAKIVDAAVETIKIDGNAVTVPVGKRASLPFSKTIFASSTSWAEVDSGVFVTWQTNDDDIPQAIIANASCSISGTSGDGSFQLRIRAKWSSTGAILGSINKRVRNDEANSAAVSGFLAMPSGWTGSVDNSIEIVIEAFCGSSNRVINDYALNVSGAKR
jgi:hypothetical protein